MCDLRFIMQQRKGVCVRIMYGAEDVCVCVLKYTKGVRLYGESEAEKAEESRERIESDSEI